MADGAHGLTGVLRGVRQDGRIAVVGCAEVAIKDFAVTKESRGVRFPG